MKNLISEVSSIQKELKEIRTKLFADIITEGVDDPEVTSAKESKILQVIK